jgi:hypothetical protein
MDKSIEIKCYFMIKFGVLQSVAFEREISDAK